MTPQKVCHLAADILAAHPFFPHEKRDDRGGALCAVMAIDQAVYELDRFEEQLTDVAIEVLLQKLGFEPDGKTSRRRQVINWSDSQPTKEPVIEALRSV